MILKRPYLCSGMDIFRFEADPCIFTISKLTPTGPNVLPRSRLTRFVGAIVVTSHEIDASATSLKYMWPEHDEGASIVAQSHC